MHRRGGSQRRVEDVAADVVKENVDPFGTAASGWLSWRCALLAYPRQSGAGTPSSRAAMLTPPPMRSPSLSSTTLSTGYEKRSVKSRRLISGPYFAASRARRYDPLRVQTRQAIRTTTKG